MIVFNEQGNSYKQDLIRSERPGETKKVSQVKKRA